MCNPPLVLFYLLLKYGTVAVAIAVASAIAVAGGSALRNYSSQMVNLHAA